MRFQENMPGIARVPRTRLAVVIHGHPMVILWSSICFRRQAIRCQEERWVAPDASKALKGSQGAHTDQVMQIAAQGFFQEAETCKTRTAHLQANLAGARPITAGPLRLQSWRSSREGRLWNTCPPLNPEVLPTHGCSRISGKGSQVTQVQRMDMHGRVRPREVIWIKSWGLTPLQR